MKIIESGKFPKKPKISVYEELASLPAGTVVHLRPGDDFHDDGDNSHRRARMRIISAMRYRGLSVSTAAGDGGIYVKINGTANGDGANRLRAVN